MEGFGPTSPLLTACRWLPTSGLAGSDLEHDVAIDAQLRFTGGVVFLVKTKFWVNWPKHHAASMPLSVGHYDRLWWVGYTMG